MVHYEVDTGTRDFGKFGVPHKNTPGNGLPYRTYACNDVHGLSEITEHYTGQKSKTALPGFGAIYRYTVC